ncbi:MAG: hypothetical protein IJ783_01210 [Kiritimatiellae bacterium]|nr:hypothetical protein [Kiritimatiellia bacterium]
MIDIRDNNEPFDDEDPEITELPFPTVKHYCGSEVVEEYVIPDDKRAEVLERLFIFDPVPGLDELVVDIHENRAFRVRDYKVVKDSQGLWLVSPYYFSSGGTVIDWVPADQTEGYDPPVEG